MLTAIRGGAAMFVAGAAAMASAQLQASYEHVWQGAQPDGVHPIRITLANSGRDDAGELVVGNESSRIRAPFELTRGAAKEFTIYAPAPDLLGESTVSTRSRQTAVKINISPPGAYDPYSGFDVPRVGVITQTPGRYRFLAPTEGAGQPARSLGETRPETAPDRAAGYYGFRSILMGEGTERLTDRQVEALKRWVATGGHLIFPVGANSPPINDPRWDSILPVTGVRGAARTMPRSFLARGAPQGTLSWADAELTLADSVLREEGRIFRASRTVGIGTVTFLPWDPTEATLRDWDGKTASVANIVDRSSWGRQQLSLYPAAALPQNTGVYFDRSSYPTAVPGTGSVFEVEPPEIGPLFAILLGFWLTVIPIQFFVLAKLKQSHLAWVLTPVISAAFAAGLFALSGELYSKTGGTRTSGVLFAADNGPEALFIGRQEIFFPKAGQTDFNFERVEAVYFSYSPFGSQANVLASALTDAGEMRGQRVNVDSLSFHELNMMQASTFEGRFRSTMRIIDAKAVEIAVENSSPLSLVGPVIKAPFLEEKPLGEKIEPGQTLKAQVKITAELPTAASAPLLLRGVLNEPIFGGKPKEAASAESSVTVAYGMRAEVIGK